MRVFRQFGILGALLLASATAALCEGMTVEPGDVLRVTIAGAPDIGRDNAKVDADGRIMLPSLGGIAVVGADLDTIRGRIADLLVAQDLMRQPTVDGGGGELPARSTSAGRWRTPARSPSSRG